MLQVTDYSSYRDDTGIFPRETHLQLVSRIHEVRNENDQSIRKHSEAFSRPIDSNLFGADAMCGSCHLAPSLPSANLIHLQRQEQHPVERCETGPLHGAKKVPLEGFVPCPPFDMDGR